MPDFTALRAKLDTAEDELTHALYQKVVVPGAATQAAFVKAQQDVRAAKSMLSAAVAASLTAGADSAASLRGDLPIALFPVRVETHFVRSTPVVRGTGGVTTTIGSARA